MRVWHPAGPVEDCRDEQEADKLPFASLGGLDDFRCECASSYRIKLHLTNNK